MQLPNFVIMWYDIPCVRVEHTGKDWVFKRLSDTFLPTMLYGVSMKQEPSFVRLNKFFADRVFPRDRDNARQLLEGLGLDSYDPTAICFRLYGFCSHDNFWIKFDGVNESMTWRDRNNLFFYPWFNSMEILNQFGGGIG